MLDALPGWAGTVPQWITAVSSAGILGAISLVIRWQLGVRKLQIEAERVVIEGKKVDVADEADLRDHWSKEVEQLRDKLDKQETRFQDALDKQSERHNNALTALEERHGRAMLFMEDRQAKCEQERDRISTRLTDTEQKLSGVLKQISLQSADNLMILEAVGSSDVQPEALEAAKRIVERHRLENGEGTRDE